MIPGINGETLALFTFANIEGLEAIEKAVARVRTRITQHEAT